MSDPFDPNERLNSPEEFVNSVQDAHKAGNLLITDIMTRAAGDPQYLADLGVSMGRLEEFADFYGRAGKALTLTSFAQEAAQGNYGKAGEIALNYATGQALEKGYSDVIEAMTRKSFTDKYGFSPRAESFHKALSGQVAGLGADITIEGAKLGAEMMNHVAQSIQNAHQDYVRSQQDERTAGFQNKFDGIERALYLGGIAEYNTHDGGLSGNLGRSILKQTSEIVNHQLQDNGYGGFFRAGAGSVDDFITVKPDDVSPTPQYDGYAEIDLEKTNSIDVDVTNTLDNYAYAYAFDAERNNPERDFDLSDISLNIAQTISRADHAVIDLTDQQRYLNEVREEARLGIQIDRYSQFRGVIDASDKNGGVVMIGKNGGILKGSSHDDIILDGSVVEAGIGNDIIFVDYRSYGKVNSGAGDDVIVGGKNRDKLYGGSGKDELRGGGGNDEIHGTGPKGTPDDNERDVLVGGKGDDNYYVGHDDVIIATAGEDKKDSITFDGITLRGPDFDRYPAQHGDLMRGEHGESYSLNTETNTLTVKYGKKVLTIENYEYGDFKLDVPIVVQGRVPLDNPNSSSSDSALEPQPINYNPDNGGASLEEVVKYLRGNRASMLENLDEKISNSTATPQETQMSDFLKVGASADIFRQLDNAGVKRINWQENPHISPEENGVNVYRAVADAAIENNIQLNTQAKASYERPTQESDASYAII